MKARTVVGRGGEEGPLCDRGSELVLGGREGGREGESSARIINGTKKKNKKKWTVKL